MTREISLPPSKIRFMHNRIASKFSDGRLVNETVEKIASGLMNVYDLPLIRVVRRNGFYYAFDNRRLYVYRVLEHRGRLDQVRVKLASANKFQPKRFSTINNGKSVVVSRGITLPHSEATAPAETDVVDVDDDDDDDDVYGMYDFEDDYSVFSHFVDDDDDDDDVYGMYDFEF